MPLVLCTTDRLDGYGWKAISFSPYEGIFFLQIAIGDLFLKIEIGWVE